MIILDTNHQLFSSESELFKWTNEQWVMMQMAKLLHSMPKQFFNPCSWVTYSRNYGSDNPSWLSVVAPTLMLAGDISILQTFFLAHCERFEHIFYVAGNHCFYEEKYGDRLEKLRELDNLNLRIHFLHSKSYFLPNNVLVIMCLFLVI